MKSIVLDCETTGLTLPSCLGPEAQPRIIELAFAVVVDGSVAAERSWLLNPGVLITPEITKITGLTDQDLSAAPAFSFVLPEIIELFAGTDQLFAHNAPFDQACLEYELKRSECNEFPWPPTIACTVQEYVHEFGFRPKLTDLYQRKLGRELKQTHRALDDVRALVEILLAEGLL
jgi:DNA polymerase-3 subunit epsilon